VKANPKVSVVIPTYNYGYYLDESIQSVLNQTYCDFELIVVDDNSTDNTNEVVKKYLHDNRVFYFKNEKTLGLGANFNQCLKYTNGDYIKYLMADDKFHPELLEKFVQIMNGYSNVSLVTCNQEIFGIINKPFELPFLHLQPGKKIMWESLKTFNWIGGPTSVMFRKPNSSLLNFRSDLNFIVDWEMWIKLLAIGDCYILPERLVYSRVHSNQATVVMTQNYLRRFEEYYFYKEIYKENKSQVGVSMEIIKIKKRKAKDCVRAAIKILPKFYKKGIFLLIKKAIIIALNENVLF
jgi:glycosyltransferase involved in cell wall biosynthesis